MNDLIVEIEGFVMSMTNALLQFEAVMGLYKNHFFDSFRVTVIFVKFLYCSLPCY